MTIFTPFQILSLPNQGEWDYRGMQHTWERQYFGYEAVKERENLEDKDVDGSIS